MIYFLAFLSGTVAFTLFTYFPYSVVLLCCSGAFVLYRKRNFAAVALLALGLFYPALNDVPANIMPFRSGNVTVAGHFRSPPVKLSGGYVQEFELAGSGGRIDVLSGEEFETGREYELNLRVISPSERNNPGAIRSGQYAVLGYVKDAGELHRSLAVYFNRLRERLNRVIGSRFEPEAASLVMAVTTGHRAGMSYELKDACRASGLAHLLSISGTHFGLVFLILFGLLSAAIKALPVRVLQRLTLYLTPPQAAALLCLPFLLMYLGISGARIPTVRSFIMISLFLFGLLFGRRGHWLNFLVLAALVLVVMEPAVTSSISFQLSFLAVLFIGYFLSGRPRRREDGPEGEEKPRRSRLVTYPLNTLVITLAATAGVAPLVAYYFHYASLVSPLANLFVTPIVCMVLVPLSIAGSFTYLATGDFVLDPLIGWVAGGTITLVKAFASAPYSSVPVRAFPPAVLVFYYLGFLLYFVSRQRRFLALPVLSVLVPLAVWAASDRGLVVTFLDAGSADASVIELPDDKVIVVDAGRRGKEVRRYLRTRGIKSIDALVLTHADYAHAGGAPALIRQFDVGELWDNGRLVYPDDFPEGPVRRALARGDVIEGEGYALSVLHPYGGFYTESGSKGTRVNNDSLVLRVSGKAVSVLFAGDIEAEAMDDIVHLGGSVESDVLKLSDHGRPGSAFAGFLGAVSPSVVVMNKEDGDVRPLAGGARLLTLRADGAVRVEEAGGGMRIRTYVEDAKLARASRPREELSNIRRLFTSF